MKVAELLSSPANWTQESFARNCDGEAVDYNSSDAVQFCLMGAVMRCYRDRENPFPCRDAMDKIADRLGDKTCWGKVSEFNDKSSYDEVMNLVKELDI